MSSVRPAAAKSYLGAIRALHFLAGIDTSGIDDPRIPLILKGGKRVHGEGAKRIRYPLTDDILLHVVREINNDKEGVNIKTAFCVAFAAFLRSGDFTWDTWSTSSHLTHLAWKHVTFHPSFVTLTLPASKTDQFRVGTDIYLASNPLSPLCPVKALRVLFDRYPASPHAPLFTRPFQQPFTKTFFVRSMHQLLFNAGIPTFGYSGHSLWKGAAVTADRNGISRHHIKLLGRWESDAVDIYINECRQSERKHRLLHLNAQLLSPLIH
jgi:hypothetical protein